MVMQEPPREEPASQMAVFFRPLASQLRCCHATVRSELRCPFPPRNVVELTATTQPKLLVAMVILTNEHLPNVMGVVMSAACACRAELRYQTNVRKHGRLCCFTHRRRPLLDTVDERGWPCWIPRMARVCSLGVHQSCCRDQARNTTKTLSDATECASQLCDPAFEGADREQGKTESKISGQLSHAPGAVLPSAPSFIVVRGSLSQPHLEALPCSRSCGASVWVTAVPRRSHRLRARVECGGWVRSSRRACLQQRRMGRREHSRAVQPSAVMFASKG